MGRAIMVRSFALISDRAATRFAHTELLAMME
jgi:hypothetical protein